MLWFRVKKSGTARSKRTWHSLSVLLSRANAAQDMGLPFLNPYLAMNRSFDHGANFAVAGATAMDPADQFNRRFSMPFTANSLKLQLRWFKDFMKSTFNTDEGNSKIFLPSLLSLNASSVFNSQAY